MGINNSIQLLIQGLDLLVIKGKHSRSLSVNKKVRSSIFS